ncbi:dipeptide/oligopeptide/nickel ABC transporter permease/ATP-binding protein [Demequina zhanjiangensis]|uniref:Dipeptide/oligopeptide/nickel ABC transporter permease/ATP-binding protein n=1 Tax=Demequina zhanjiangensis TaxID=3051659 RepID=A0ABT8G4W3_9MICO|nr:dipeptide/oligopeptide/nickel ABC transporter permease/ATP-binding protein [Demequina sp. SYSU T00b26]MDN4474153.1 dipeptide/oligopeptide/nickel ABC transporter permease/ATP-binding protein [Demequina sp. SYSU T00b26]
MTDLRRRLNAPLVAGLAIMAALAVVAIVAPFTLREAADTLGGAPRSAPSAEHWLGTDSLGRDVLARSLVATRLTLLMALGATALSAIPGILIGASVWFGPRTLRNLVLRLIDSTVAFPSLVLALVIAAILGPATSSAVIAIGVAGIPAFARITSNMTASVIHSDYITTARLLGVPRWRNFTRHLMPNIGGPLLVLGASSFALALLEISSLSFVGLGVQSPDYDWGRLLSEALPSIYSMPMIAIAPSAMLIIAGVGAMLTGDGLARHLDPWSSAPARAPRTGTVTTTAPRTSDLVQIDDLRVTAANGTPLVHGLSMRIGAGEIVGLVGESGSGKSMTAMSLARLQPDSVTVEAATLRVGDLDMRKGGRRTAMATDIGLIFQDPTRSLNPALRLGGQLTEVLTVHMSMLRRAARRTLVDGFERVRIRDAEHRLSQHPHELSGGMLQRTMIASALATNPRLIIADEPTTALDVTVQAEVLRQLKRINQDDATAILFISHDLGVVEALCDRVLVMHQGSIVEELTSEQLAARDVSHPYTQRLLDATPSLSLTDARQEDPA